MILRFFRFLVVGIFLLSSFSIGAQLIPDAAALPYQLTDRIIIHYERPNQRAARGFEISLEHKALVNQLTTSFKFAVRNHKPVYSRIVKQIVDRNQTESEVHKEMLLKAGRQNTARSIPTRNTSLSHSLVLYLNNPDDVQRLIDEINANSLLPNVSEFRNIRAERIHLSYLGVAPNDPLYSSQWAHQVTEAEAAWNTETGNAGAIIGIIDSGVDLNHEDLANNIIVGGYDFVDIDTDQYESYGYDLIPGEDYTTIDNNPSDYNGHGTHVAGIAAGSGNNNTGISGVCHSCGILPVRAGFSIKYGGTTYGVLQDDAIANAIIYATDQGADVINMSFGGRGSITMQNAINYAYNNGVVLIAAAGNSNSNNAQYPARYEQVIAVASSGLDDERSYFSNYGDWVDVTAPGQDILSTVPSVGDLSNGTGYRTLSGTSMASPYVAGIAGLLKSKNPLLTNEEIMATLVSTTDNIDVNNPGYINLLGSGRVNVNKAINNTAAPNILLNGSSFTELTGNQDNRINPGEQISLTVSLKNTWADAASVTASLSSSDPFVAITQAGSDYQDIPMNVVKNGLSPFVFTVSAATPDNHILEFNLQVNASGNIKNIPLVFESTVTDKLEVPAQFATIQAAINAAGNGDEIVVSPGRYYENINFIGKNISVVSLYHSTGNRSYIENTIIDGSDPSDITKASVVTFANGENSSALLSGFTITGGTGTYTTLPGNPFINYFGGGIFCVQANPMISNLIIRENSLTSPNGSGGGILISDGAPTLSDLYITENKVSAGLYLNKVNNPGNVTARNIRVTRSIDSDGIYITTSTVKLKNITVEDCNAGVAVGLFSLYSTVDIDSATITGNRRGVDARANNRVTIRNAAITANGIGGGIWCNSSTLELINTTVAGNSIHNHYGGGGVFISDEESKLVLVNSILYKNSWTELNTGIVRPNSISFLNNGSEITAAYSNVEGGQAGLHFFSGSGNVTQNWLAGNINADPLFFRPQQNDYHLSDGSPSSGTGIARFDYGGKTYVDLQPDQYQGIRPDMGAYLLNQAYLKALFTVNKTSGNLPLAIQFTDESYGYKTIPPDNWNWDFGDGTTSSLRNPLHQYNAIGTYTVKLSVRNNVYEDTEIKLALINVFDSDTLYVAGTGINSPAAGTENNPFRTIQYGIDQASNNDVILVRDGLYRENINFHGKKVRVSSFYVIDGNDSHITSTLIDGNNHGSVVVFNSGENSNTGLSGLTVQNGFADGDNYPQYYGGGLFIEDSSPTIVDVVIKNNKTNYRGGGIFIDNGSPRLERVTVTSNQSLYSFSEGAGIYISSSSAVIKDSKITLNTSNHNGAGLFLGYQATPIVNNLMIRENTALNVGGGVHIESNNLTLSEMYVLNNTAAQGAGIYSSFSNNTISYSVIADNSASTGGGGLYYLGNSANPRLDRVTLYNNTGPAGGSIQLNGTAKVFISNSIVWNNTGTLITGTAFITYSDIKGGWTGTGNINANPQLLNIASEDYTLDFSSPCIDAGDPAAIADPNGTRADMGALYYDRPIIERTTQPVIMPEDSEKELRLSDFVVKNGGAAYPGDYVLSLSAGPNYTVSGNIVKPASNYNGFLTVPVVMNSSSLSSQTFQLSLTVTPVNDAPIITAQVPMTVSGGQALLLTTAHFTYTDVDNSGPFTLRVLAGTNYSITGNTITPSLGFSGVLSVPVVISDGTVDSQPFQTQVSVTPAEHSILISGQHEVTMDEDEERTINLTDLIITVTGSADPLTLELEAGEHYSLSGPKVVPDKDFNGTLFVSVFVHNSLAQSNTFELTIQVTPVNDPPMITGQVPLTVSAGQPLSLNSTHFTYTDGDNSGPFTLRVLAGTNYSITGNTITPSPGFSGVLSVPVVISDGTVDSQPFQAQVSVTPAEHSILISGQNEVTMDEDEERTINLRDLIITVTGSGDPLTLELEAGEHYSLSGQKVVPNKDFNGILSIPVLVHHSLAQSNTFELNIQVTPVNDAPVILGAREITIEEGTTFTLSLSDLAISDPDNSVSDMELTILPGSGYTVDSNTIHFNPSVGPTLSVAVQVSDGMANSEIFTVTINVPVVTGTEHQFMDNFHLYPNPSQDYIQLSNTDKHQISSINLISQDGRPQNVQPTFDRDFIFIPVDHLADGIYILCIKVSGGVEVWEKVIIAR